MDIFKLISRYIEHCERHPESINNTASALYLYLLNLNNKLGWPEKFGLPRDYVMTILGTSSHKTYTKAVENLIQWGFLKQLSKSQNQYQSNVFALVKNTRASTKARSEQIPEQVPELDSSTLCIDIPIKTNKSNIKVRVAKYVEYLNTVFDKKYKVTEKVIGNFKARIETDNYPTQILRAVIDNLKLSTYHIDTNFRYCTPEFCLRQSKIEMYKSGPIIQKVTNGKQETPQPPTKIDESKIIEFQRSQLPQATAAGD